jgi:3-oxoacyl-[acyl-carrier protein] reductase|tara:strand:+ start:8393 stop:9187 length:795 start_codon:yes stop_codon:yes gene_type:complete
MTVKHSMKDKTAIVTGGSHGIGLAIARQLGENGCKVIVCSRTQERLDSTKTEFDKSNINCATYKFDALNPKNTLDVVKTIIKDNPKIDILINNVGGGGSWGVSDVTKTDLSVWREVLEKNTFSASIFTQQVLPSMIKNGWGRVITISSIIGKESRADCRPWFNMAKAAQVALMKSLSKDKKLVREGITFNTVSPGGIFIEETGFAKLKQEDPKEYKSMVDRDYPLGRQGSPEEVANLVTFLCSESSSLINGSQIVIDGGQTNSY